MAFLGIPLQAPYSGAKHGVQGVFESLRTELRRPGSRVHLRTVHLPGVYTIWGSRLAPWPAERYLARTAVSGQLSDAEKAPDRRDNLFEPPPGDPGTHGPYDDRAHRRSVQWCASCHRRTLGAGACRRGRGRTANAVSSRL